VSEPLPESDWKHLRAVSALALERYSGRVLEEASVIIGDVHASHHQRYLRLYRLLQERDATVAAAFDDLRRSTAIQHLAALIRLRLLTGEELAGFSRDTVTSAKV
jgi:hypothetical protein